MAENDIEALAVEQVVRAIQDERDRWRCLTGGHGLDDVIVRDDDDGEPQEVSRHPFGDGGMYFYDTLDRALAKAALTALRSTTAEPDPAPVDNRVCRICDGGPGNECACTCGMELYDAHHTDSAAKDAEPVEERAQAWARERWPSSYDYAEREACAEAYIAGATAALANRGEAGALAKERGE